MPKIIEINATSHVNLPELMTTDQFLIVTNPSGVHHGGAHTLNNSEPTRTSLDTLISLDPVVTWMLARQIIREELKFQKILSQKQLARVTEMLKGDKEMRKLAIEILRPAGRYLANLVEALANNDYYMAQRHISRYSSSNFLNLTDEIL